MGVKAQAKVFNNSLEIVEKKNKELLQLYKNARDKVELQIASLKLKIEAGQFAEARTDRVVRLETFLKKINEDIKTLIDAQFNITTSGYVDSYSNAYYGYGYDIERDLNLKILAKEPFDYTLGYRKLNTPYITQIYTSDIATKIWGAPLKQAAISEVLQLQAKVRQATTQAIIEGIGPKELSKRLAGIDEIYENNMNRAYNTARTEILRGFSYGSHEALLIAEDAGVQGRKIWDATLDGFTRPDHRRMDKESREGTQPNKQGFFVFPDGSFGRFPRDATLSAKESINCRCSIGYEQEGLTLNSRGYRAADGSWKQTNGDMSYMEWADTLEGKRSIEQAEKYTRARAKRLAELRREGKKAPLIPSTKKRYEQVNK